MTCLLRSVLKSCRTVFYLISFHRFHNRPFGYVEARAAGPQLSAHACCWLTAVGKLDPLIYSSLEIRSTQLQLSAEVICRLIADCRGVLPTRNCFCGQDLLPHSYRRQDLVTHSCCKQLWCDMLTHNSLEIRSADPKLSVNKISRSADVCRQDSLLTAFVRHHLLTHRATAVWRRDLLTHSYLQTRTASPELSAEKVCWPTAFVY